MSPLTYSDEFIADILTSVRTIAMPGASPDPSRTSNSVMAELQDHGYHVLPVNPDAAGSNIHGEKVFSDLHSIAEKFQMVDIFRNSHAAADSVKQAVAEAQNKGISVIWMQLGVRNDEAAKRAEAIGLKVVMDRCPLIEINRLFGGCLPAV